MDEGDYYKIYGYTYNKKGEIHINKILDKDFNLSGYNTKKIHLSIKMRSL